MSEPTFRRLIPEGVEASLAASPRTIVLDVRRRDAFEKDPRGIGGAVPVVLDRTPVRVPDLERSRPIIAYCL
ncbi:MAG: hypothetical protein ACREQ9_16220 [Candidatus Binatia bacterium]